MRIQRTYLALFLVTIAVNAVEAQRGRFHSPEAPTAALLLIGGLGMTFGSSLLSRFGKK